MSDFQTEEVMIETKAAVKLADLYQKDYIKQQIRFRAAIRSFDDYFPSESFDFIFSSPGLTELCGNHSGNGNVLAAAIDLDTIALVKKTDSDNIIVHSKGKKPVAVNINDLTPDDKRFGQSSELIRGIAAGMKEAGYKIGGFSAYTESTIPKGSGLAASTAFEMIICTIFSQLFNDSSIPALTLARIAESAEKAFYGKRNVFIYKLIAAYGGINECDLNDKENPVIKGVDFDMKGTGFSLCITKTPEEPGQFAGANAFIPHELRSVAELMNVSSLSETNKEAVMARMSYIRKMSGDRAFLRTMHFFEENERVCEAAQALRDGDFETYLRVMKISGDSSYKYLQNIYPPENPFSQGSAFALFLSDGVLRIKGVSKIQGGGFSGSIQSYVPCDMAEQYIMAMEAGFGLGCCREIQFRKYGCVQIENIYASSVH
jgi:galactokinase